MKKKIIKICIFVLAVTAIAGGVRYLGRVTGIAWTVRKTDVYEQYFGANGEHRVNGLLKNEIFPESIPESAKIEKFVYRHEDLMDPSDAAILVYTCNEEDDKVEMSRLAELGTKEEDAYDVYGITGFPYEVVAVKADSVYGVIYAMTEPDVRRIIYVENTYCNYFSDINYERYIGQRYLPKGYNAKPGNPVREAFDAKMR